jgi:peroxiredoxin Q/BCP
MPRGRAGDTLEVGQQAPSFSGPLVRPDGQTTDTALAALLEDGPVLISFYTVDFSPDCIEEWCAFRDFDWFTAGSVQVVGVSKSSTWLHRQFIDRLELEFPLYSDPDLAISEAFGVAYRALGVSRRSKRSCFLVDTDQTIRYRWVGDHWLDPTRDVPPVGEIHEEIRAIVEQEDSETFGF